MPIDPRSVQEMAALARLQIDPSEEDRLSKELAAILSYVEQLQSLDISGIEPTSQVGSGSRAHLRADVVRPCEIREEALGQAPDRDGDFIRVPRVV